MPNVDNKGLSSSQVDPAPAGATVVLPSTTPSTIKFLGDDGQTHALQSAPASPPQILQGTTAPTVGTAAPTGVTSFQNLLTGETTHFVDASGNWQSVVSGTPPEVITGATSPVVGSTAPAGAKLFVDSTINRVTRYVNSVGNWAAIPIPQEGTPFYANSAPATDAYQAKTGAVWRAGPIGVGDFEPVPGVLNTVVGGGLHSHQAAAGADLTFLHLTNVATGYSGNTGWSAQLSAGAAPSFRWVQRVASTPMTWFATDGSVALRVTPLPYNNPIGTNLNPSSITFPNHPSARNDNAIVPHTTGGYAYTDTTGNLCIVPYAVLRAAIRPNFLQVAISATQTITAVNQAVGGMASVATQGGQIALIGGNTLRITPPNAGLPTAIPVVYRIFVNLTYKPATGNNAAEYRLFNVTTGAYVGTGVSHYGMNLASAEGTTGVIEFYTPALTVVTDFQLRVPSAGGFPVNVSGGTANRLTTISVTEM